jgi:hypothetical protein
MHGKSKSVQTAKIFDFAPILLFDPGGPILPTALNGRRRVEPLVKDEQSAPAGFP